MEGIPGAGRPGFLRGFVPGSAPVGREPRPQTSNDAASFFGTGAFRNRT